MESIYSYGNEIKGIAELSADKQEELFNLYQSGDTDSFKELAESFLKLAYGISLEYIKKCSLSEENAWDLLQEASFIGVKNGIDRWEKEKGAMSTSVYYWCKKAVMEYLNENVFVSAPIELETEIGEDITLEETIEQTTFETPEEALLKKETHERVEKYLSILPEVQQKVVRLYLELGSFTKIAERLNISRQSAQKSYNQALKRIRKQIAA